MSTSGPLTDDRYRALVTDPQGVLARVSMNVGESEEYGALKVSATVTLTCDQTSEKLRDAGEYAFLAALDLVQEGFKAFKEGK